MERKIIVLEKQLEWEALPRFLFFFLFFFSHLAIFQGLRGVMVIGDERKSPRDSNIVHSPFDLASARLDQFIIRSNQLPHQLLPQLLPIHNQRVPDTQSAAVIEMGEQRGEKKKKKKKKKKIRSAEDLERSVREGNVATQRSRAGNHQQLASPQMNERTVAPTAVLTTPRESTSVILDEVECPHFFFFLLRGKKKKSLAHSHLDQPLQRLQLVPGSLVVSTDHRMKRSGRQNPALRGAAAPMKRTETPTKASVQASTRAHSSPPSSPYFIFSKKK